MRMRLTAAIPVTLPPGRARLAARPTPTGSKEIDTTIGSVLVKRLMAKAPVLSEAMATSGFQATSSAATTGRRSGFASVQKCSIARLRPFTQPSSRRPPSTSSM